MNPFRLLRANHTFLVTVARRLATHHPLVADFIFFDLMGFHFDGRSKFYPELDLIYSSINF